MITYCRRWYCGWYLTTRGRPRSMSPMLLVYRSRCSSVKTEEYGRSCWWYTLDLYSVRVLWSYHHSHSPALAHKNVRRVTIVTAVTCERPWQQAVREAATICPALCKLTFWPWKWCPSHVWRGLLCASFSLSRPLCSRLRPDVRDRQTSDKQTSDAHHRLMPLGGGIIKMSLSPWSKATAGSVVFMLGYM